MGLDKHVSTIMGSSGDSAVKNLPANAGHTGNLGLILCLKDLPEEEMTTDNHILA